MGLGILVKEKKRTRTYEEHFFEVEFRTMSTSTC